MARNISKSMMSYMNKVREQKEFLIKETQQYDRSKRHLANMMGIEPQEMTQEDVDDAIKYLFPSGLFDKRARPILKHPEILHKAVKEAQFDSDGRPNHYLFYTTLPNFYESLARIVDLIEELNKYEDEQLPKGQIDPPADAKYNLLSRRWLTSDELNNKLSENVDSLKYEYFIRSANALLNHPYSTKAKDFIEDFTKELPATSLSLQLPDLLKDENGRTYTQMVTRHREHRVETRVTFDGTGKIDIENHDILFFKSYGNRRNVYFPIQMTKLQDQIDIHSRIVYQPKTFGESAVASAIREAVSRSIAACVDSDMRERMRIAGLLTTDMRLRERKKPGQEGARRKFTWKKR